MADLKSHKTEMELSLGDTIQVGNQFLTVIDIEGDEILFQLDSELPPEPKSNLMQDTNSRSRSCR